MRGHAPAGQLARDMAELRKSRTRLADAAVGHFCDLVPLGNAGKEVLPTLNRE